MVLLLVMSIFLPTPTYFAEWNSTWIITILNDPRIAENHDWTLSKPKKRWREKGKWQRENCFSKREVAAKELKWFSLSQLFDIVIYCRIFSPKALFHNHFHTEKFNQHLFFIFTVKIMFSLEEPKFSMVFLKFFKGLF